jgi:aspartate racemase
LNRRFKSITGSQPDIVMENLPVSAEEEEKMIKGEICSQHLELLTRAVDSLGRSGAYLIAIPCNTVHVFIDILRERSVVPILSIIEECAAECEQRGLKKVGLLATTRTVREGLHAAKRSEKRISALVPSEEEQGEVSRIVLKILDGTAGEIEAEKLLGIAEKLKEMGAEAIILGCTDLPLLFPESKIGIPVLSTLEVLEEACVKRMTLTQAPLPLPK